MEYVEYIVTHEGGDAVAAIFVYGLIAFLAILAVMIPCILAYEYGKDWLNRG